MAVVKKKPQRYECIFRNPLIRTDVNPRLAALGKTLDREVPYATFQRLWRQNHCVSVNPYGSEDCPYRPEDCVLAYWKTAAEAMEAKTSPLGLFKILARRRGYDRAENKPLARERHEAGVGRTDRPTGRGLPGPKTGPVRIGEVLGTLHVGTRERRVDPRQEGSER